jgi:hypothetical protein
MSNEGAPDCSEDAGRDIILGGCRANYSLEDSALEDFFRDILTGQIDGNWRSGRYNAVTKFIIRRENNEFIVADVSELSSPSAGWRSAQESSRVGLVLVFLLLRRP